MAYCAKCGTLEVEGQKFCAVCGAPTSSSTSMAPMPPLTSNDMSGEARVLVGISLDPPVQARWTIFFRSPHCVPQSSLGSPHCSRDACPMGSKRSSPVRCAFTPTFLRTCFF